MDQDIINYVAAAIDSGSYFSIRHTQGSYVGNLRLKRRDAAVLKYIQGYFPGNLVGSINGVWLNYSGVRCMKILQAVYPYLKTKKPHAELLMRFLTEVKVRKCKPGQRLSEENRAIRLKMVQEMAILNNYSSGQ